MFLFNRNTEPGTLSLFKQDGHEWRQRSDCKTTQEARKKLKVGRTHSTAHPQILFGNACLLADVMCHLSMGRLHDIYCARVQIGDEHFLTYTLFVPAKRAAE